jgi:hypothetical protein
MPRFLRLLRRFPLPEPTILNPYRSVIQELTKNPHESRGSSSVKLYLFAGIGKKPRHGKPSVAERRTQPPQGSGFEKLHVLGTEAAFLNRTQGRDVNSQSVQFVFAAPPSIPKISCFDTRPTTTLIRDDKGHFFFLGFPWFLVRGMGGDAVDPLIASWPGHLPSTVSRGRQSGPFWLFLHWRISSRVGVEEDTGLAGMETVMWRAVCDRLDWSAG